MRFLSFATLIFSLALGVRVLAQTPPPAGAGQPVAQPVAPGLNAEIKNDKEKLEQDRKELKDKIEKVHADRKKLQEDRKAGASPDVLAQDREQLKKDIEARREEHKEVNKDKEELRKDRKERREHRRARRHGEPEKK